MSQLVQREIILAKIESTYNTDPTPAVSNDEILVQNISWSNEGLRMVERPVVRPSLGALQQVYGGRLVTMSFDVEMKGPGSAYSASVRPETDVLLRCCALAVTVDTTPGSETATYNPVSTPSSHESCTIYYFEDGKRYKLTGVRGNVSLNAETGNVGMLSFSMTGHISNPTDVALPTPSYDSTVPPAVVGGSFTIDSYAAVINAITMDLNNSLVFPPSMSASDGYGEIQIVKRDVAGSFDPESTLVAAEDWHGNFTSGAAMALATGVISGAQYNRWQLTAPGVYYRDIAPGNREGLRTYEMSCGFAESSTDDEFSLVFS